MSEQIAIMGALSMDLKRVALSLHRGSYTTANKFKEEALKRGQELENQKMDSYVIKLLLGVKACLLGNSEKTAEDALMYSTLFQNYALKKLN